MHHFNAHFSLNVFFANDLLPAIYFICILDYRNYVRQKANLSNFYLSSKLIINQPRQLATSTTHLAKELLTNIKCSGGSSFAEEMRREPGRC